MTIEIVNSLPEHIWPLCANMRDADKAEVQKLGLSPRLAVRSSFRNSMMCRTVLVDGEVAAMYGVVGTPMGLVGRPWMLSAKASELKGALPFAFLYRQEIKNMLKMFPMLENWVDAAYTESVRLLQLVGFKLDDAEPLGANKAMFRRFYKGIGHGY